MPVALTVVGSINLDLVVRTKRLPRPGETLSDATFTQVPGGKGANQAVAAARLGAQVTMIGAVGTDAFAEPAVAGLRAAGVTPAWVQKQGQTGVATRIRPTVSYANKKMLTASSAPIAHINTTVAGHQSENHEPIIQAGARTSGKPGR